jgi:AcrR family transcriptional regulator
MRFKGLASAGNDLLAVETNPSLHVTVVSCNMRYMKSNGERKEELLERIVDVFLSQGISDVSLRPLAKSVGTSARLLIYHFSSKESLVAEALQRVRQRMQQEFLKLADPKKDQSLEGVFLLFWKWVQARQNQGHVRLFLQVYGLALHDHAKYARYLAGTTETWVRFLDRGFQQFPARSHYSSEVVRTYIVASFRGLLLDLLATGDRQRTTEALYLLIETVSRMVGGKMSSHKQTANRRNNAASRRVRV